MSYDMSLSKLNCPKSCVDRKKMRNIPYITDSIDNACNLCTGPNFSYALSNKSRYQLYPIDGY